MSMNFIPRQTARWAGDAPETVGARKLAKRRRSAPEVRQRFGRIELVADASGTATVVPAAGSAPLTLTESIGLEALKLKSSQAFIESKTHRTDLGKVWDMPAAHNSQILGRPRKRKASLGVGAPAPAALKNDRLGGSIGIGLIFVNGPSADLRFTSGQKAQVAAELQVATEWLQDQSAAANISWDTQIMDANIAVPETSAAINVPNDLRWINPMLASLGITSGSATGLGKLVTRVKTALGTQRAIAILMTKYGIEVSYAYAIQENRFLTVSTKDSGGGIRANLDAVLAHEMCHLFGAPDEYAGACSCGGSWGIYNKPNRACEPCGAPEDCMMRVLSYRLCVPTRHHLGFPDPGEWPA